MIRNWKSILAVLIFVLLPTTADAVVFVSSNISTETWDAASGPYIIQNGSILPTGNTLTIELGTIIKFTEYSFLWVYGTLNVNGEDQDKVYFTSIKDDEVGGDTNNDGNLTAPSAEDWRQISIKTGGNANIDNAVIKYGGNTVCGYHTYCKGGLYNAYGNVYLKNSEIIHNGQFGIYHAYGSTAIENSEIAYNDRGVHINSGSLTINNSSIHDNVIGILNNINNGIIDATNNWWGDLSGPTTLENSGGVGDLVYNGVNFTPWLGSEPGTEINPVLIIPGILGSWEKNGEWVIDPVFHTYDDLINTLVLNGYEEDVDLFTLPYDWKNSNVDTALLLDEKISEIKIICECEKVDIVAHSMGGLVSRQYVQSDEYDDDVDQLIFLGTPHLGSSKSYLLWEGGESGTKATDNIIKFIYTNEAKKNGYGDLFDYVRNRPIASIQQLLPTFDYLMEYESSTMRIYPNQYPRNEFLEDLNLNVSKLLNSDINITNIIGNNQDTIEKMKVTESSYLPKWEHGYPIGYYENIGDRGIEYGSGDRTVTTQSASFINEDLNILTSTHVSLPKNGQTLIFEKLTGDAPVQISSEFELPNLKLLIIKILSPVDVQVIAPDGKVIGKDFNGEIEINEIHGAFYSGFETDNEYITIINPIYGDYSVITQGTDEGGEYTIAIGLIDDDNLVENNFVSNILPNNFEEIVVTLNQSVNGEISIVEDTDILFIDLISHINQAYLLGWIPNHKFKGQLERIVDKMIKEEQKIIKHEERGQHKHKDKKFNKKLIKLLEKEFIKKLRGGLKSRKINEEGYNLLKEDVYLLINNL